MSAHIHPSFFIHERHPKLKSHALESLSFKLFNFHADTKEGRCHFDSSHGRLNIHTLRPLRAYMFIPDLFTCQCNKFVFSSCLSSLLTSHWLYNLMKNLNKNDALFLCLISMKSIIETANKVVQSYAYIYENSRLERKTIKMISARLIGALLPCLTFLSTLQLSNIFMLLIFHFVG